MRTWPNTPPGSPPWPNKRDRKNGGRGRAPPAVLRTHPLHPSVGGDAHAVERSGTSTLGVHRPAVSPPHPLRCSVGAGDPVRPLYPVIPSQCSHWRGNPYPAPAGAESPASLCEAAQCSHWVVRSEAKLRCQRAALTEGLSKGIFRAPARGTFALGGKSTQKRRSNLRFENPLRAFTRHLSCLSLPRERCAMQISPKYCIVYASLSAAAFALKCKTAHFSTVHGKDIIKWRPLAATYLCRFAAKARFDNRLNPRGEVSKGRGRDPSLWKPHPGGLGDYQIALLPRSGKGRWRPRAAI